MLKLWLLGTLEARAGEIFLRIPHGKQRGVLLKLATAGRPVTADELIELFWPDKPYEKALNALYKTLSRIRKIFTSMGADSPIKTSGAGFSIAPAEVWIDVAQFEEELNCGLAAEKRGDLGVAREHLNEALSLRRPGEILGGIDCPKFTGNEILRIKEKLARARETWCGIGLQLGEYYGVLPFLEELAQGDPLNESVHAKLMRALYQTKGQAAALGVYYGIRDRLREDQGIDPGEELQRLYLEMLGSRTEAVPRPRTGKRLAAAG